MKELTEIEKHISNNNLREALTNLQIYAKIHNEIETVQWCEYELCGYPSDKLETLPEYRKIDHKDLLVYLSKENISTIIKIEELIKFVAEDIEGATERVNKLINSLLSNKTYMEYGINKIHIYEKDCSVHERKLSTIMKDVRINDNGVKVKPDFSQLLLNEHVVERLRKEIERKILYYAKNIYNKKIKENIVNKKPKNNKFKYYLSCTRKFIVGLIAFLSDFQQIKWGWLDFIKNLFH